MTELPGSTAPILLHQTSRYPAQRGVVWGRLVPPPLWTLGLIPEAPPWWWWWWWRWWWWWWWRWWWWWWWGKGDAQPLLHDLVYSVPVVLMVPRGTRRVVLLAPLTPLAQRLSRVHRPVPCALALGQCRSVLLQMSSWLALCCCASGSPAFSCCGLRC